MVFAGGGFAGGGEVKGVGCGKVGKKHYCNGGLGGL